MQINALGKTGRAGVIAAGIGTLALTAAACSSASTAASGASPTHHPMASHSAAAAAATFGSDCGMIPASGMGSMHAMMTDPIVTAAAHNPLLAEMFDSFVAVLREALLTVVTDSGLGDVGADAAHTRLAEAIEAGDTAAAERATHDHLDPTAAAVRSLIDA